MQTLDEQSQPSSSKHRFFVQMAYFDPLLSEMCGSDHRPMARVRLSKLNLLLGLNFVALLLVLMAGSCAYLKHHPELIEDSRTYATVLSGLEPAMEKGVAEDMLAKAAAKYDAAEHDNLAKNTKATNVHEEANASKAKEISTLDVGSAKHADIKRARDTLDSAHKASWEMSVKHASAKHVWHNPLNDKPPQTPAAEDHGGLLPNIPVTYLPYVVVGFMLAVPILTVSVLKGCWALIDLFVPVQGAPQPDNYAARKHREADVEEGAALGSAPRVVGTLSSAPSAGQGALPDDFWSKAGSGDSCSASGSSATMVHVDEID